VCEFEKYIETLNITQETRGHLNYWYYKLLSAKSDITKLICEKVLWGFFKALSSEKKVTIEQHTKLSDFIEQKNSPK